MDWKGKRFVPFNDEVLWKGSMAKGVYDNQTNRKVISFSNEEDRRFGGLRERIASAMNEHYTDGDVQPYEFAEELYLQLTGKKHTNA